MTWDPDLLGGFRLGEGEHGVLLGRSGAGKTTLVKQLLGLVGPVIGRRGSPLAPRCAYVPQTDGVFLDLTVIDNLVHPSPGVPGVSPAVAEDWLDVVGLAEQGQVATSELPLAQRRRVALARALSRERPILLIDGDLDATLSRFLPDLLGRVPHLRTILTTSCIADDRVWNADRGAVVDEGRVVAHGTMASVMAISNPDVRAALAWTLP